MARIGHKKSRNGCSRCKERKVKCDEKRPCGACVRQKVTCSLGQSPELDEGHADSRLQAPRGTVPAGKLRRRVSPVRASKSHSPPLRLGAFSYDVARPVAGFKYQQPFGWTVDLGLMSHYSCCTATTLPGASRRTWQYEVPREAVAYPFLMHQILAVSAFHLSSLETPQHQTHLTQAFQHQHHAICGIQPEIAHITPQNCHALFAASSMLFIGAFAASAPATDSSRQGDLDAMLNIFTLLRGVGGILESSKDIKMARQGVLGEFMQCDLPAGRSELLSLLLEKLPLITQRLNWDGVNPEAKDLAEEAIRSLQESVAISSAGLPELNVAFYWPMTLQDGFMALLRVYHPAALVVLAHYCVVLHAVGSDYWFLRGWGRRIITSITVSLVPTWHDSIRWPMEYVKESEASLTSDSGAESWRQESGTMTVGTGSQSSRTPRSE